MADHALSFGTDGQPNSYAGIAGDGGSVAEGSETVQGEGEADLMQPGELPRVPAQGRLDLAGGLRKVAEDHIGEADVYYLGHTLAGQCDTHAEKLEPLVDRYGEQALEEPDRLYHDLLDQTRGSGIGLLRDLHDLYLM